MHRKIILGVVALFSLPTTLFAFSLSPQYGGTSAGTVSYASDFSPAEQLFVFRVDNGAWVANTSEAAITITESNWDGSTDFWIVPVVSNSYGWGGCASTFDECIADDAHYVSSIGYQRLYYGSESDHSIQSDTETHTSVFRPDIQITSPIAGSVFSRIIPIQYQSSGDSVSLFYSDKSVEWDGNLINPALKSPVASNLLPSGSYDWSWRNLIEGVFYRIIGDSFNSRGDVGESLSDFFTVDFTPPVFRVSVSPAVARGGDVSISIDSSEDLALIPHVEVAQEGASPNAISVKGERGHYEGIYTITPGHDGLAHIYVSGRDAAGNIGTTTVSGGTFSVGVNPPPAPRITSPSPKSTVAASTISITGSTRGDTDVILKVNGTDRAVAKPDAAGLFTFSGVALEKTHNQGVNFLSLIARDASGMLGEAATLEVKLNVPPLVSLAKPLDREVVNDRAAIVATGSDGNGDPLLFTYQVARAADALREQSWSTIAEALPSSGFSWNATDVDDGDYFLRVLASDGDTTATSTPIRITVKNTLPFLRFDDGRKTYAKGATATVSGTAMTSQNLSVRPNISEVDYSLDNGKNWTIALAPVGGYAAERRFLVTLPNLKEGVYPIIWRVLDSRNLTGRSIHPVIVDTTAPAAPTLSSPRPRAVLSSLADEDARPGLQTALSGTAEPSSLVTLSYAGTSMTARALPNGLFSFPRVTFDSKGVQNITLVASDDTGNKSSPYTTTLIYDNPPEILALSPKQFRGVSGVAHLVWKIDDADGDAIQGASVRYRKGAGAYRTLVSDARSLRSLDWDTSSLPEANDYELFIQASDGLATSSLLSGFSVDRSTPASPSLTIGRPLAKGEAFSASGAAYDSISGIEFVEYSLRQNDMSTPWYTSIITRGFLDNDASYMIRHRASTPDGSYTLAVRAVDAAGNVSPEVARELRIDRTAPRVGAFFVEANGVHVPPDVTGDIALPVGGTYRFNVSLEDDTADASIRFAGEETGLTHDFASGLWQASIDTVSATTSRLILSAKDALGNETGKVDIGSIISIEQGRMTSRASDGSESPAVGVRLHVLKLNEETGQFDPFVAAGQGEVVIVSDALGRYDLALPSGTYRLIALLSGHETVDEEVSLEQPGFVDRTFTLDEVSGFWAWILSVMDGFRY